MILALLASWRFNSFSLGSELLHALVAEVGHVDRAAAVHAEGVRAVELARPLALGAPAADRPAVGAEDEHPVGQPVRHEQPSAAEEEAVRRPALAPLTEELAVTVEQLHALVL